MTRFARAKGSKASNERLPEEATPWHLMKQQLEDSVASKSPQVKTKSCKELLREQEAPYYGELGVINNDWAEIEPEKVKSSTKEVSEKSPVVKKNKKTHLETADTSINPETTVPSPKKSKKRKSIASVVESTPISSENPHSSVPNNSPEEKKRKIVDELIEDPQKSGEKKKKKKKKNGSKNESSPPEDSKPQKPKLDNSEKNCQENEETDKPTVKLSKRQKRNRKNKLKNSENGDAEARDENKTIPGEFNTEGNEWSTEIKFRSKKKLMRTNGEVNITSTDVKNSQNNISKIKKDDINKSYNQKMIKKRKPPKIRDENEHKRRKPNPGATKVIINGLEIEIVMYDGFPVKKEDAERLTELRKQMIMKGIPKSEINAAMKLERRKAEKALTRVKKNVCFHCRKAGHNLSDCPDLGKEEAATGICFKCGSTEHTHFQCRVTKKEEFGFAKCFICREQGHIAKQCPDNPKGLYPQGGACKNCGDVTHLRKDCPDIVNGKEESTITLETISGDTVEDLDSERKIQVMDKPKQKIVTF